MRSRLLFLSLLGPASAFYTLPYTLLARDPTVAQEAPATKTATELIKDCAGCRAERGICDKGRRAG